MQQNQTPGAILLTPIHNSRLHRIQRERTNLPVKYYQAEDTPYPHPQSVLPLCAKLDWWCC